MDKLIELIEKKRPNAAASSRTTYKYLLRGLFYMAHDKKTEMDVDWFSKTDEVVEVLKRRPLSTRKTTAAALLAVCDDHECGAYKEMMLKDKDEFNELVLNGKKSKTQEENWEEFSTIKAVVDRMYMKVKPLLNSKEPLSKSEHKEVQTFIILALTTGVFIPPRRSTDWTAMKIHGAIDKTTDNYIEKGHFVFNTYKTAKDIGQQRFEIPKELKNILTKWVKLSPNDWMISSYLSNAPITATRLSQILNSIFDKKISTSLLRHIYISDKLKDVPALKELTEMASEMGHSVAEQLKYIRR